MAGGHGGATGYHEARALRSQDAGFDAQKPAGLLHVHNEQPQQGPEKTTLLGASGNKMPGNELSGRAGAGARSTCVSEHGVRGSGGPVLSGSRRALTRSLPKRRPPAGSRRQQSGRETCIRCQGHRIAKIILKKNKMGEFTVSDVKTYVEATGMTTARTDMRTDIQVSPEQTRRFRVN